MNVEPIHRVRAARLGLAPPIPETSTVAADSLLLTRLAPAAYLAAVEAIDDSDIDGPEYRTLPNETNDRASINLDRRGRLWVQVAYDGVILSPDDLRAFGYAALVLADLAEVAS